MLFGNQEPEKKKVNISEMAHISTLSEEERTELENDEETSVSDCESSEEKPSYEQKPETSKFWRLEHTEPVISIVAKPDCQTMFDFMMYHSYANVLGVLSVLIGLAAIAMVIIGLINQSGWLQIALFLAVAVMFVSNSPLTLKRKARKQSELICNDANTITYTFSDAGFDMSRGTDEYADFGWSNMYKVKEGKNGFYMYIEKNRAFVIPKNQLENIDEFKAMLSRHVEKRLFFAKEENK